LTRVHQHEPFTAIQLHYRLRPNRLGPSLVNSLFVLDEPSIGLHPRDIARVIRVLHRLREAGNSLLVVEHDAQMIQAADRVLDLGPGPGERGGDVVFFGTPKRLLRSKQSLTGRYLSGHKRVLSDEPSRPRPAPAEPALTIRGAAQHNLRAIDVSIPLNRLVCITGVSGSGKSTLVQDVLYQGLRKLQGKPEAPPGRHRAIEGHQLIEQVVMVDQSPIGKSARSNPASYVKALDVIRKVFAASPEARERGYKAGAFSFNSGMRCPTCGGTGFQHIEMQFLSDVYLRCPDCDGKRYRPEVLEIKIAGARPGGERMSIADVLELTVAEAAAFFSPHPEVDRALRPLERVGLGYLKLGQPVPTLSGGESQRLKLAGHLAKAASDKRDGSSAPGGALFLFDEPTTGLHFDDIATLLRAFRHLLEGGHSLVVIEHNLDVIRGADWVIDLGPEGGDAGGAIVCAGTTEDLMRCRKSHTGKALSQAGAENARAVEYRPHTGRKKAASVHDAPAVYDARPNHAIRIHKAREHNLKNVDIRIPRDRFTVITGISGSGKSTVAFDILFSEGQRRYLESLNAYARQFVQPAARPDVDAIFGIPPTVAIEQRTSRGGRKSTVATLTELYHFLRLLFVKLGIQHCPDCDIPIRPQSVEAILAGILKAYRGQTITVLAPLVVNRKGYYTDLAAWAAKKGFSHLRVDGELTPTATWPRLKRFQEHNIEAPIGTVNVGAPQEKVIRALVERALEFGNGVVQVLESSAAKSTPAGDGSIFSTQRACPRCSRSFPELDPRLFSFNSKHGWCRTCYGTGLLLDEFDEEQTGEETWWNAWWDGEEQRCPDCDGKRLRAEALAVRFRDRSIAGYTSMSVDTAQHHFREMALPPGEAEVARDILAELRSRLEFLARVGLNYLTLDRAAPTLSGGEAQRIRLASQLGSNLRGVCYILDEPTIGLHARDNRMLLDTLQTLERKGNTVVVVEHDEETIRRAEHIVDLGPGGGVDGGRLVAQGTLDRVLKSKQSITGRFLNQPLTHPLTARRRAKADASIDIEGAHLHNLRDVDVTIPLQRLVCVTGVSGSGKSSLVRDILHDNLKQQLGLGRKRAQRKRLRGCAGIEGLQHVRRVLEVDQTPIGKTPRSCPATYVGFWTTVRRLFAETTEARIRGYGPGRFSFNVHGGRCASCEGQGLKKIEMSFLPDVKVPCEACGGARFNRETLEVRYKDKSIAEVLAMSVDEAVSFFEAHPSIHHALELLREVGLGYLALGQQSPTLSGGEAQRIKLVTELAKTRTVDPRPTRGTGANGTATLYVLDEPTIGLHMADVEKLIRVLHRLVSAGHTVVVIEHNLDVIAEADWVIDLGPEGGAQGGRVVARGTPEQVARAYRASHTGNILREFLKERRR